MATIDPAAMDTTTQEWKQLNLLITRPKGRGDQLIEFLTSQGAQSKHIPFVAIEPLELSSIDQQVAYDLDQFSHVIVVSQPAAELATELLENYWPQWPVQQQWWAIGESTAAVLRQANLSVKVAEPATSEGLIKAPLLQNLQQQKILLVKGINGREVIAEHCQAQGAELTQWNLYQRCAVTSETLISQIAQQNFNAIWATSAQIVDILYSVSERAKLQNVPLFVPSERVKLAAQALGFQQVFNTNGANDQSCIKSLQQWLAGELSG